MAVADRVHVESSLLTGGVVLDAGINGRKQNVEVTND